MKLLQPALLEPISEQKKGFHRTESKDGGKPFDGQKRLRKTISNPNLRSSPKSAGSDSKSDTKKHEEYDEMFFYYYENILQQVLDKLCLSKSHKNRDRTQSFYS